jgi:ribosomal protein S18 acetylase RimI-like enzyme
VDVRPYRPGDEEEVVALWGTCFPDSRSWSEPREVIRRKLEVQGDLLLVGTLEDRVVATVVAGYDGHRGWIYHLAVAPGCRRRGLGARMMAAAEVRLRTLGCPKINLQVYPTNRAVVGFYERFGFVVEERISMGKPIA